MCLADCGNVLGYVSCYVFLRVGKYCFLLFPHVVHGNALSFCIALRGFVVVLSTMLFLVYWVDVHGKSGVCLFVV